MKIRGKGRRSVTGASIRGLSLIELMVALVIGLMLSGAVTIIYVNDKHAYVVQDNVANLQENGRTALHYLREDVRMAGYWGLNYAANTISSTGTVSLGSECFAGWATDYINPFTSQNNDNGLYETCIPDADFTANTDILTIRHAASQPYTAPCPADSSKTFCPGHLYLVASLTEGAVSKAAGDGTISASIAEEPKGNYEVQAYAYYVRPWSETVGDGIPALVREVISNVDEDGNSVPTGIIVAERLVEYVEDFQVTFGLDTNGDEAVDLYDNNGIDASDIPNVLSIVVEILVRANTPEANYTNTRTYQLGDRVLPPFNDGIRRQVFRDTLFIRNWSGLGA